ncbi:putative 1-phosphatidylinositol-3-phosphate 5-kinase FAB1D [Oryza brachyantha]|uniref:1-phosphatidylinositol-3-phosphate 5-kinase n=1 Tax=Oryza brachyantha TaxID=4533 RepID=J3M303_ORYBR|nr:putative 1-phosphatidylinositol-3-phosphate 5-kinase FAB1D [Oryza brachyantha]
MAISYPPADYCSDSDDVWDWVPPAAAAADDDDPTTPSSSSRGDDDERQRAAMLSAMNGQLNILASRFLASAGVDPEWLDVVTSLSWEGALLIQPHACTAGNDMDPASYVKVKCVASGSRRQCEVIKAGLVFRKNAAHKHMPSKCHRPRLVLLQGALGLDSHLGFSSFDSMEQDKQSLGASIAHIVRTCRPNVVMVEKTVSRDIQELLLQHGVTLLLDMKLHRLQRIARTCGAPLLSFSQLLDCPKLKHCDYFHIDKFFEEHNHHTLPAGKRQSKSLVFLEGFSNPLGCTILLRGANTEELKKVKQVLQYTVFAAYHLVLETSFFEDQRVFLNDREDGIPEITHQTPLISNCSLPAASPTDYRESLQEYYAGDQATTVSFTNKPPDALNSSAGHGTTINCDPNEAPPSENLLSSVSGSLRRFIDIFRYQNIYLPVTSSQDSTGHREEEKTEISQEMESDDALEKEKEPDHSYQYMDQLSDLQEQVFAKINQRKAQPDPLVTEKHEQLSVPMGDVEQYSTGYIGENRNSDTDEADDGLDSQSILILLSSQCATKQVICEQSHLYRINYYGNFDVSLGRYLQDILQNQNLSCSSCGEPPDAHIYSYTHRNGNLTVSVKRLLPRHHLPGESEGKIWMWTRCLRCEHESGMSKSSRRVLISTEARNLSFGKFLELSFSSHSAAKRLSVCGHLVNRDCLRFFGLGSKVAKFQYSAVEIYTACKPQRTLEFHNPNMHEWFEQEGRNVLASGVKLFSEVASLIQHIKNQFPEVAINCGDFLPVKEVSQLEEMLMEEKAQFVDSLVKAVEQSRMSSSSVNEILNVNWLYQDLLILLYMWDRRFHQLLECKSERKANCIKKDTVEFTGEPATDESAGSKLSLANGCIKATQYIEQPGMDRYSSTFLDENSRDERREKQHITEVPSFRNLEGLDIQGTGPVTNSVSIKQEQSGMPHFGIPEWYGRETWVWSPLQELRVSYRHELQVGCLEKFELVNNYSPSHLSHLHKQSSTEFAVGPGGNVLCISEDEISSIISRALAISEERRHLLLDSIVEGEAAYSRGTESSKMEKSYSSLSETSSASSSWSSIGSSDSDASFSSDDLFSSYDSSLLSSPLHPEVSVNGKLSLKGKYSVICVHANQFYTLRKKCCPSELAYITSLSRCKKWDAQGGKSKAFFAKTLDDRFIIKQIQKTEFESFIKFAPDYFKHVYHSLDTGSQTCLAKILGIYQVKQIKHGREVKLDLMVMENLLFGHKVSRIYDLKGVVFSRYISDSNDHGTVYLDQNFVDDMRVSPIYVGGRMKHLLQRAIWNDTAFLTSINVMDYSLLVGVDEDRHGFVFGIIDYLRQYTWDKQLETWVKTSLVVPKNASPTVISPKEYKKRFRKFMAKYFLTVPDDWST